MGGVPKWQVDSSDATHRFANPTVRTALKGREDSYVDSLKEAGKVNKALKEAIIQIVGARNMESEEATSTELDYECEAMSKRRVSMECIIGFLSRLRNRNIHNFFIVTLSILALGCNVPVQFWSLLCTMGILFSKVWTVELVREIGDEIAACKPEGCSDNIGLYVSDNKAYFVTTAHVHAEEVEGVTTAPRMPNGKYLYTVNNLQVPLKLETDIEILPGTFNLLNFHKPFVHPNFISGILRSVESTCRVFNRSGPSDCSI